MVYLLHFTLGLLLHIIPQGLANNDHCPYTQWRTGYFGSANPATPLNPSGHLPTNYINGMYNTGLGVGKEVVRCAVPPTNCTPAYYYRSYDGSCNNLQDPGLGMANSKYTRLVTPKYSDHSMAPTLSVVGTPLPNARQLSLAIWGEESLPDEFRTLLTMQWGQFVAHDISLLTTKGAPKDCCSKGSQHKQCYPILLHPRDPLAYGSGKTCLHFARGVSEADSICPNADYSASKTEKLSIVTAVLDLSSLYGNSVEQNKKVRQFSGGLLKTTTIKNRQWPPVLINVNGVCGQNNYQCYSIPDRRNQFTPAITILHTIMLREHNRIACALGQINPQLNDEQLFQEARKISIAQYQKIVYHDYLPLIIGPSYAYSANILQYGDPSEPFDDYDPNVNPAPYAEYATAAFRYAHNQIPGRFSLIGSNRYDNHTLRLSDYFERAENINFLSHNENFDALIRGMATQLQKRPDGNMDKEIQYYFNRKPFEEYGTDLKAIDIQRGRDFRLASYNDLREFCGLPRAYDWSDFANEISGEKISLLQRLYASPEDVDLNVGGSLESHAHEAILGPTFQCIVGKQFLKSRVGDRFFFQRGDVYGGFNRAQLREIHKVSISSLLCSNADHLQYIQPNAFIAPNKRNYIVSCESIPQLDLTKWTT